MNDTSHESGTLVGGTTFRDIVLGFSEHPLYLLIFSLIFTALVLCIYAFLTVSDSNLEFLAVGGFIVMGLAAFLVIRSIEVGKARQRVYEIESRLQQQVDRTEQLSNKLETEDSEGINLKNDDIKAHFVSAISNTRKALTYDNRSFHEEIEAAVAYFDKQTGEWSNGCLITDAFNYERIVLNFYKHAQHSVFATSNEYYVKLWMNEDRSKKFIDAHRKAYEANRATVTRVFIFSSLGAIDQDSFRVMEKQEKLSFISTRALILDEHDRFRLPPNLIKDFVIIDKGLPTEAIGIESSVDLSSVGAKWIFSGDPDFEKTAQWMDQTSISLEQLKTRMEKLVI